MEQPLVTGATCGAGSIPPNTRSSRCCAPGRFTRLTNGHSKKNRTHDAMLDLYFAWYNWCRKQSTPTVKAGLTDSVWTLIELLTVAAAA